MSSAQDFENFFKPEARSSGADFVRKDSIRLSLGSDTQVQAFIKVSSGVKVSFTADSIESAVFSADCSCPASAKGVLCKHIWATLLKVSEELPDFLDSKTEIEKKSRLSEKPQQQKEKNASFRKSQYQQQKARIKETKRADKAKKFSAPVPTYPEDVTEALKYFTDNGFPLGDDIDPELLRDAKKKLAKLMHPDQGGSHEEFLTLNVHLDVISEFVEFRS